MGQPEDLRCSVQYLQANAGTKPTLCYNHLLPHFSNTGLQILQIFPPNREPPRRPPSYVFIQLVARLKRPGHKTSGTNVVCECQELNLHSHTRLHGVICQKKCFNCIMTSHIQFYFLIPNVTYHTTPFTRLSSFLNKEPHNFVRF